MFSEISIEKLKTNSECGLVDEEEFDSLYNFLLINVISIINKNNGVYNQHKNPENIANKYLSTLNRYGCYDLFTFDRFEDFSIFKNKLEKEAISILSFKKGIFKKQEAYHLLSELERFYTKKLHKEILTQDREKSLQILYTLAGILSFINFNHRHWDGSGHIDKNKINLVSELLAENYEDIKVNIDSFFGEIKKTIEMTIHFILNTNKKFKNIKKMDFPKICGYTVLFMKVKEFKSLISEIYSDNGYIEVREQIILSKNKTQKINGLMSRNTEVIYPLNRTKSIQIYTAFFDEYGFSPQFLEDYLVDYPEKILDTSTMINLIEDKLLIMDIKNKTGQS